jgi:hypothetical protein
MAERVAGWVIWGMYTYVLAGSIFAGCFVARGVQKVDSEARSAGIGFRLLIFPGAVAFWPLLLKRWVAAAGEPPGERNPHQ